MLLCLKVWLANSTHEGLYSKVGAAPLCRKCMFCDDASSGVAEESYIILLQKSGIGARKLATSQEKDIAGLFLVEFLGTQRV